MTKLLFITWDGPQTSYLEGLFYPILDGIQKDTNIQIHVLQFSWGPKEKFIRLEEMGKQLSIFYTQIPVSRNLSVALGSIYTLIKGIKLIREYIKENNIDIVMPRSIFPAIMVNNVKGNFKVIYDADGLPIDERVDFAGLSQKSFMYRFLKAQEKIMLETADIILTRTNKAIKIHLESIGQQFTYKFSKVWNGRDPEVFKANPNKAKEIRMDLGVNSEAKLFVYAGSLGPQYGLEIMLAIFQEYQEKHPGAKFLILTASNEYLTKNVTLDILSNIIVKKVAPHEVGAYLGACDVAFAIRKPTFSMKGVAPIKIPEYLFLELPIIASQGIGDTDQELTDLDFVFLFNHSDLSATEKAVEFIEKLNPENFKKIREFAIENYSLEKAIKSYQDALESLL